MQHVVYARWHLRPTACRGLTRLWSVLVARTTTRPGRRRFRHTHTHQAAGHVCWERHRGIMVNARRASPRHSPENGATRVPGFVGFARERGIRPFGPRARVDRLLMRRETDGVERCVCPFIGKTTGAQHCVQKVRRQCVSGYTPPLGRPRCLSRWTYAVIRVWSGEGVVPPSLPVSNASLLSPAELAVPGCGSNACRARAPLVRHGHQSGDVGGGGGAHRRRLRARARR